MRQNRRFAFAFRLGALIFAAAGVLAQVGVFAGRPGGASFMYYTIQSNVLAVVLFAALTVRTFIGMRENPRGNADWFARFGMVCAVDIMVTFVVFWTLLAPQVDAGYLLTFENIAVHTVTPLLCLADFLIFTNGGCLKHRDIYYACIFPAAYVIFSAAAGLLGYVYHYTGFADASGAAGQMIPVRAPYFFLDYWSLGAWAAVYIAGILAFFILLGYGLYFLDKRR